MQYCQKNRHLKDIYPIIYKIFSFFIFIMYISFCETNKKNVLQREIKDLAFEVSDPSTHFLKFFPTRDPIYMLSTRRRGREVLSGKFVMCLQIINFKYKNHFVSHFESLNQLIIILVQYSVKLWKLDHSKLWLLGIWWKKSGLWFTSTPLISV